MVSVEGAILSAPARTFRALVGEGGRSSIVGPIGRTVVAALLLGLTMTTTATEVARGIVVLRTTLAWSFAVAVQLLGALALVAVSPGRRVPALRAFDLLLATNGAWTLWLAGFTLWIGLGSPVGRNIHYAMPSLVLPATWTAGVLVPYCEVVLGDTRRQALRKVALHQAAMWGIGAAYFFWAVQGWPRLLAWWPF